MQKRTWPFQILYYVLVALIYIGVLTCCAKLFSVRDSEGYLNLGNVIVMTYLLVFFLTPVMIAALMRFSLLRWYVDPFAAAIVPLYFYFGMVINRVKRTGDWIKAFQDENASLSSNGDGWLFLIGLFLFGLACSFSIARKNGENISYKLLAKIRKE